MEILTGVFEDPDGNQLLPRTDVLDTEEEIKANTDSGKAAGAQVVKRVISDFADGQMEIRLVDGKGEYREKGADTWIPFSSPMCWNSHGYYGYGCALDTSNYRYLEITSHVAIHVFYCSGYTDYEHYAPRYADTNYGENTLIAAVAADVTQVIDVSQYDMVIFSAQNNVGGSSGQNLNSTIAWGRMYN